MTARPARWAPHEEAGQNCIRLDRFLCLRKLSKEKLAPMPSAK